MSSNDERAKRRMMLHDAMADGCLRLAIEYRLAGFTDVAQAYRERAAHERKCADEIGEKILVGGISEDHL